LYPAFLMRTHSGCSTLWRLYCILYPLHMYWKVTSKIVKRSKRGNVVHALRHRHQTTHFLYTSASYFALYSLLVKTTGTKDSHPCNWDSQNWPTAKWGESIGYGYVTYMVR
jgi:hypothetical protein